METTLLEAGKTVDRPLAPGERHHYRVELAAGDFLHLVAEQRGIDVAVDFFDPAADGDPTLTVDSPSGPEGPEELVAIAEVGGVHRIAVRPFPGQEEGRYELHLHPPHPATAADRDLVEADRTFRSAEKLGTSPRQAREALALYRQIVDFERRPGRERRLAGVLFGIGRRHQELDDYAAALGPLLEAAELFAAVGDRWQHPYALLRAGFVQYHLGRSQEALDLYAEALDRLEALGDLRGRAIAHDRIGDVHNRLGEIQEALDAHRRALELSRELGDPGVEAGRWASYGYVLLGLYRGQEAYDAFARAHQLHGELGDRGAMARDLKGMGEAATLLGRYVDAVDHLERSLALRRERGQGGQALVHVALGNAHLDQESKVAALRSFEEALKLARESQNVGERAIALRSSARFYRVAGQLERSLELYDQALELYRVAGDAKSRPSCLAGSARTLHEMGRFAEAHGRIEEAIDAVETFRLDPVSEEVRSTYFAFRQDYFDVAVDLLMHRHADEPKAGHASRALATHERRRARALLDRLAENRAGLRADADPDLLDREQKVQRRIGDLAASADEAPERIEELLRQLDELRGEIRRTSPRYAALALPEPLDPAAIRERVLDDETLVLVYALGEERSFLWLVAKGGVRSYELDEGPELVARVHTAADLFTRSGTLARALPAKLADLSERLLGPAAGKLGDKRLVIVADGALQSLAFGALPLPGQGPGAEPLLVRHEVLMVPSVSTLAELRRLRERRPAPTRTVAVVADPVFEAGDPRVAAKEGSGEPPSEESQPWSEELQSAARSAGVEGFERLTYSGVEAEAIAEHAPDRPLVATGFEAGRELVEKGALRDFRILHFATHGLLADHHPDLSGLVLSLVDAEGNRRDGYLRAHEIANLDLRADLVVLSACQTGVGKELRGEGLLSLTRAFMYAGVPRAIVSLWKVDDRATAELMDRFYAAHLEEGLPPAAALRKAQLSLREETEWKEPRHWAGFVLQGDWR